MKINEKKIQKLANLARLKLDKRQIDDMTLDFTKLVAFIDKLDELNIANIEPLIHVNQIENIYREDQVIQKDSKEKLLKRSPSSNSDYFKVPKINSKK